MLEGNTLISFFVNAGVTKYIFFLSLLHREVILFLMLFSMILDKIELHSLLGLNFFICIKPSSEDAVCFIHGQCWEGNFEGSGS